MSAGVLQELSESGPVDGIVAKAGISRRSATLASECYAMLDDYVVFSLVSWRPVIEQLLGLQLATTLRGGRVSWTLAENSAAPSASGSPAGSRWSQKYSPESIPFQRAVTAS